MTKEWEIERRWDKSHRVLEEIVYQRKRYSNALLKLEIVLSFSLAKNTFRFVSPDFHISRVLPLHKWHFNMFIWYGYIKNITKYCWHVVTVKESYASRFGFQVYFMTRYLYINVWPESEAFTVNLWIGNASYHCRYKYLERFVGKIAIVSLAIAVNLSSYVHWWYIFLCQNGQCQSFYSVQWLLW